MTGAARAVTRATVTGPRHRLACLPTPLHRLPGLERELGLPELWVKRDDLTGFALAGNKARPLEFLLGEAVRRGCDVLVTGGSGTSNYCQAVAVAAAGIGVGCELVIAGREPAALPVNLRVARGCGAVVTYTGVDDRDSVDAAIEARAQRLAEQGHRPFPMPRGGATAIGGLGFAQAAVELQQQLDDVGLAPARVVLATGSGGTQAGLLAGATARGVGWAVHGASVSRPPQEAAEQVHRLAAECAQLLGAEPPGPQDVHLHDARGAGFGVADPSEQELTGQALRADGILLDATYTAKALRVAVELARREGGPTVFWHTGGTVSAVGAWSKSGAST